MSEATPCKSCGRANSGRYCSACGEKVLTPDDHTLKHYLGALLNAFTFADSKLWTTLKAVVLRPGELSAAYMEGRRVKYMRPVAFFFLANFIYFAIPIFQTFNTPLNGQMHHMPYSALAKGLVESKMAATGLSLESFTARYDPASSSNAKLLLVLMVFILVLPIGLLYLRKQRYMSAYVTVAFEMMSFYVWVSTIVLGLIAVLVTESMGALGIEARWLLSDKGLTAPLIALHGWVTIGVGRRFFGCSWPGALWRSAAMLFGLQLALTAYRLILFMVTFWSIDA